MKSSICQMQGNSPNDKFHHESGATESAIESVTESEKVNEVPKTNIMDEVNELRSLGIDSWSKLQEYARKKARRLEMDEWLKLGIDSWSKLQEYEREQGR